MSRRFWIGVVSALLAVSALTAVGVGAYHAGRHDRVTTEVVTGGQVGSGGDVVRVVHGHWGWGYGPGPGFFFFPLFIGLIIALVVLTRRRRPYGPWGWGYGPPPAFEQWHRQVHESGQPPAGPAGQPGTAGPGESP